jgi:hypothetical protein
MRVESRTVRDSIMCVINEILHEVFMLALN